jgi:hypothetical protein
VAALWLLAACSSDDAAEQDGQEEFKLEARAITRTGGDTDTNYSDIMAFLSSTDGENAQGLFKYYPETDGHFWRAYNLKVKPGSRVFYLYGFMPAELEMSGLMNKDANTLTIQNLSPLSEKDICVVTGVALNERILTDQEMVTSYRGKYTFEYKNTDYQETTYLNLRLEPIFGRLEFKFKTGPEYYKLRRIKLKKVEIDAKAKEYLNATVSLPTGEYDDVAVTYTSSGTDKDRKMQLWAAEDEEDGLLTGMVTGPYGGINVAVGVGITCELTCTYEVYDLKGNSLGVRTATNSLSKVMPDKGQKRTVTLTVEPTYLYKLSDQDLDNPTMTLNE